VTARKHKIKITVQASLGKKLDLISKITREKKGLEIRLKQ
jgi:hypothetical protein